ncbi:MAG: YhdP family protein [Oceanicoccus sp.]
MLWVFLITVLIVVASYVSLGRYFIGYVEQYQDSLVNRFIDFTGLSLTVGQMHGHWSKLSPVLTMEQLILYRPGENQLTGAEAVLTISDVSFQLDPFNSILSGSLQVKTFIINGVHCAIEEIEPGRWQLQGYPIAAGGNTDFDQIIDLVLSVEGVELFDAKLQTSFANGQESVLAIEEVSLNREDDFRRLRVNAFFDQLSGPLLAIVESYGDPREQEAFTAKAYLHADDIDFSAQLPALQTLGVELENARVDSEVWLDWKPDTRVSLQGVVNMPIVDIDVISSEDLPPLENLKFGFRAEKTSEQDWQIWLPTLEAHWNGEVFNLSESHVIRNHEGVVFSVPELDVGIATRQLLSAKILNDNVTDVLATMSPSGLLHNIKLYVPREAPSTENQQSPKAFFRLRANLDRVALSPWKGAPGAVGVSGYLEMTPTSGLVELDAKTMAMEFPQVFDRPLDFESLVGQVTWEILTNRVLVDSSPLYMTADHGPAVALLDLDIPLAPVEDDPPKMTLTVGLKDTAAKFRNKFIPYTLNRGFLDWMQASVPSGHVKEGGFIYRGSLIKGDSQRRTVQLLLSLDDTALAYHPDWPALTDIEGLVEVNDLIIDVIADSAKMYELDVAKTMVRAVPLSEGGLWLTVDTTAKGSARDALRIINDSAISQMVGGAFQHWQLSGVATAAVNLGIPLAGANAAADIDVAVDLKQAKLNIPEYRLEFDHIDGPVTYDSLRGIRSSSLKARLYKKSVIVNVEQDKNRAVKVDMSGRVDMRDVQTWSRQPGLDFTAGETGFSATINIRPNDTSEFKIRSNLEGVAIDLPAPYGKPAELTGDFWLRLPIGDEAPLLRMGLAEQAELQLQFVDGIVDSGLVILDQAADERHQRNAFLVTGRISSFALDQWQPVLDRYLAANERIDAAVKIDLGATADELQAVGADLEIDNPLKIKARNLQVDKFYGFSQEFENSIVNLQRRSNDWWLSFSSKKVVGSITFPDDTNRPTVAKLESLSLHSPDASETPDDSPVDLAEINQLNIDLDISHLSIDDQSYGSIAFSARGHELGVRFENIVGEIRGISLEKEKPATIEWFRTPDGDETRFYGQLKMADIGDVLENWNYERIVESESTTSSFDLTWPGSPDQWQLSSSEGPLYLKIKEGRFLKASNSASGTMKVVGIVNFTNIIRRLQLDFSDLYESGISFDKIEGEAIFGEGKLKIVDDLAVKTPSSSFYLRGDADLMAKELDMELIATLPLASNLPWIVALAGGLPTAAGIYVASLLFEDQVDRFSSAIYRVKGDWNNPDLSFKQVFDDRKEK